MEEGCSNWTSFQSALFTPCNITDTDKDMIFGISFGFGIASLLGVVAIIGHAVAKRLYYSSDREVRSLVHLSTATAGFCICLVIFSSFYLFTSPDNIQRATIYLVTLEEVFYLVLFFLTANYTIVVYVKLRNKLNISDEQAAIETQKITRIIRHSYRISWILPPILLVPVTIAMVTRPVKITPCLLCPSVLYHPSEKGTAFDSDFLKNFGFILVIATYAVVVVVILGFITLSWRLCSRILNRISTEVCDNRSVRWLRLRMSLYTLGFFYCWTPTFVITILILADELRKLSNCTVLFYVWAVTAPCQGVVLAVIYFYSIFFQTTNFQLRRGKRTSDSKIYRFYGTGSQRFRYPSVTTPSPTLSDGSLVGDTKGNCGTLSPTTTSSSTSKKKQRSPSFLGLLKNQENDLTEGDED